MGFVLAVLVLLLSESVIQCATPKALAGNSHGTSNYYSPKSPLPMCVCVCVFMFVCAGVRFLY